MKNVAVWVFAWMLAAIFVAVRPIRSAQLKSHPEAVAGGAILLDVFARPQRPDLILRSEDFLLFDNRRQVPASSLHLVTGEDSATESHQVVVLLDAINTPFADLVRAEDALESILSATPTLGQPTSILIVSDMSPVHQDPASTVTLHHNELFVHRIPPEVSAPALLRALRLYKPTLHRILESQAGPGEAERVRLSLEALSSIANALQSVAGAKTMVWVSPGWPYLQGSAQASERLFDSVVYFSNLLRASRIMLYAVSPAPARIHTETFTPRDPSIFGSIAPQRVPIETGDTYYESFLRAPRKAAESNPNDLALQVLAAQSGGLVLGHSNDLGGLIQSCIAEAGSLYTLAYTPPADRSIERYHELTVRAPVRSRTRTGFYLH